MRSNLADDVARTKRLHAGLRTLVGMSVDGGRWQAGQTTRMLELAREAQALSIKHERIAIPLYPFAAELSDRVASGGASMADVAGALDVGDCRLRQTGSLRKLGLRQLGLLARFAYSLSECRHIAIVIEQRNALAIYNLSQKRYFLLMNWPKLIQDLIDSGLTQVQIAESCQTGQSHISALLNGSRKCPNWALGEALRNLHAEKIGAGSTAGNSGQSVE